MMSAPVNDNFVPGPGYPHGGQSFATVTITGELQDEMAFAMQNADGNVVITPGTAGGQDRLPPDGTVATPEFGSVFSLGGLLASGCAALWIRRRRRAA